MRRLALALVVLGFAAFPPPLASAGGKPTRSPLPASPEVFPAGVACSFELAVQPVVNKEVVKTFPPQPNGDVRQIITGRLAERLTNVATGKSILLNVSGPAKVTIHPDGSLTFVGGGRGMQIFFPTDIPAGPATYLFTGKTVLNVTASGQVILVSHHGTQQDLCAALS